MVLLKLILTMLGTTFLLLGYLIVFRKKYSLINGFEAALKSGEKEESDAERVGKTYLDWLEALYRDGNLMFLCLKKPSIEKIKIFKKRKSSFREYLI